MELTVDEIAAAVGGTAVCPPDADGSTVIDGATQDSRRVTTGQLFVPLLAERDGHDFVDAAIAAGAGAYLSSRGAAAKSETVPRIEVDDTAEALTRLGAACRWRSSATVVGITGSVGKTTTKDLALAACSADRRVYANPSSFNNEIGVPLTLINAPSDSDVLIVEMGARDVGHIARLCDTARPMIGVVTRVGAAHTEVFGSIAQIVEAKGELIEALPPDGIAILNATQPEVVGMERRTTAASIRFGEGGDVTANDIEVDDGLHAAFTADTPWGSVAVRLAASGAHNIDNALAALAIAGSVGVPIALAAERLETAASSPHRMAVRRHDSGATIIDDTYNANPMSMRAALDSLAAVPIGGTPRRVAVLGTMAELADGGTDEHRVVAEYAAALGVELIAYDTSAFGPQPVTTPEEAVVRIGRLDENVAVLVKASRAVELERVVALLVDPED